MDRVARRPGAAAAGGPRTPPRSGGGEGPRAHRILTWGAVLCGVLSLLVMTANLGPRALGMGLVLAVVPVPVYVAMALWLDRFEPEPTRTLVQTFAWGATVAVLLALLLNTWAEWRLQSWLGPQAALTMGRVVSGPLIEEIAKGLALLFLFHELRDEFDGVVDGVVYAAMVGLGFAMLENVQYYGQAINRGHETSMVAFAMRGIVGPFAHPLFSSMLGMGLGYARERTQPGTRRWAPPLGFAAAVVLHALWNYAASRDDVLFMTLYAAVMVPAFFGVLVVIYLSLKRESAVIREHLAVLVEQGILDADELERLCVVRGRLRATFRAWRTGGFPSWRERREMHRIASELAFHRWRVRRGLGAGEEADARRDEEYLRTLEALCRARSQTSASAATSATDTAANGDARAHSHADAVDPPAEPLPDPRSAVPPLDLARADDPKLPPDLTAGG
ncbi:MAG TPA: PrsW family intramembrane metalloprotease [Longimicrobium sp.]|nr:PrsW family intramembrane metalloprotease [Longimicrobium sp.]